MFKIRDIAESQVGNTFIHTLDPRAKIIILFALAILVVSLDNEKNLFFLFLLSLFAYPMARLSKSKYLLASLLLILGLWGTIFSQALFYGEWPRTIIFTLIPSDFPVLGKITGGLHIYKEGALHGLIQGLRFSIMTASGLLLCWTTESRRILLGLVRLRVPYRISFMVVTALRFLPLLLSELFTVVEVQRLKGFNPLAISRVLRGVLNTFTPVLANAVRRAGVLACSVESRAFGAYPERSYLEELRYRWSDLYIMIGFFVVSFAILVVKVLYGLYTRDLLYASALRWVYEIGGRL